MTAAVAQGLASVRWMSKVTSGALLAYLSLSSVGLIFAGAVMAAQSKIAGQSNQVVGLVALGITALTLLSSITSVIMTFIWIHRAHSNLRLLRLEGLNFSPAWAVASFLVPVANLFVPFRAMRELYNRSHGEEAHFAGISVSDVTSWWTCWIVVEFILAWILFTTSLGPLTGIHVVTPVQMLMGLQVFESILMIGAAFFLRRIVSKVSEAQQSNAGIADTFA